MRSSSISSSNAIKVIDVGVFGDILPNKKSSVSICSQGTYHGSCLSLSSGVCMLLHKWFVKFPQYRNRSLFIMVESHADNWWEEVTREVVQEIIFLSKHMAVSTHPALTIHSIGVPHLKEGEVPPQGGKLGWAAVPSPRMTPWLILLKRLAQLHNLVPEFEGNIFQASSLSVL